MRVKEARYVVRLGHNGIYTPRDAGALLAQLRERLRSLGAVATNPRVSRVAMEFDLFCGLERDLGPLLKALEAVGPVLTHTRLDLITPVPPPPEVLSAARKLFNEERYWEAHETLEGRWKQAQGDEKKLLQGMILTAAALVHAQRNELNVVKPMLEEAAIRLENQPASYHDLDVSRFLAEVKKAIATPAYFFPPV